MPVVPAFAHVLPFGIHGNDERHLLQPAKALDLLFAGDCRVNLAEALKIDQPVNLVLARESTSDSVLMLKDAILELAGHTGVECLRPVRHDVDVIHRFLAALGMTLLRLIGSVMPSTAPRQR